ncbi:MAG: hypothetical protein AUJ49_01005 [Desulfovibrionaceae bacterium CG1_02_65_16]|nr:MAG: hypothetical protein AUJ49_01005 [Desulfovibrionaceae bacterium CG1_02_65_16]
MMRRNNKTNRESGFSIIYLIISIVIVSIIGAAIAKISASSIMSELQLTQLNDARFLAESGIEYAKGIAAYYKNQSKPIAEAVAALNENSGVVTVANAGKFAIVATQSGTTSILVTSTGYAQTGMAKHQLPLTTIITYSTASDASTSDALKGIYSGTSANISGNFTGNFATAAPILNGGATINGSLIYLSSSPTCLSISGSVTVGVVGGNDYVCSDSCINISGGTTINGNVYAQGDVNVINGTVNGNIYAGGNVTLAKNSNNTWGGGATVNGDIYTHGTFSQPPYYTSFKGTVYYNSPVPDKCTSYTLPEHENVSSSTALSVNWSGPGSNQYIFSGKDDISDHSYAFSSINSSGGTKICFDLSKPNTYINIFDSGDMNIRSTLYVRTSTTTNCFDSVNQINSINFAQYTAASRVYMDIRGKVYFAGGSNWFGTVYAGDDISFGGGEASIGAFYTNKAFNPTNAGGLTSRFVASDYVNKYWP